MCSLEEALEYFLGSFDSTKDASTPNSRSVCNTKQSEKGPCGALLIQHFLCFQDCIVEEYCSSRGNGGHSSPLEGSLEGRKRWCRVYRRF